MIVDRAWYENGIRCATIPPRGADERRRVAGAFEWVGLFEPTQDELDLIAAEFDLHPLAAEDAVHAHQRPKLEHYDDHWFVVLRTVRFVDPVEVITAGEVMLFIGADFVVSVRHGAAGDMAKIRHDLECDPERLSEGPWTVLHSLADCVVDEYEEALRQLDVLIDEMQDEVFTDPRSTHGTRIFRLKREVLEFLRAVEPLVEPLERLSAPGSPAGDESLAYFRDVHDHARRVADRLIGIDELLTSALTLNVAQVGMRQNEDMRKISAWVAIIAVPTLVAGLYGMNFEHMPELEWRFGYPAVVVVTLLLCYALYRSFKHRGWL